LASRYRCGYQKYDHEIVGELQIVNKHVQDKRTTQSAKTSAEHGQGMLIGERRQHVLKLVERDGRVLVSELSSSLGISPITIRKDLDFMERQGLVQRTHGGALSPHNTTLLDLSLKDKESQQSREKLAIAEAAAGLVEEGQCVLLDSGTTTTAVARALRRFQHLTIVTNAMNIATELSDTDFDIILIGGNMRKNAFSLVGPLAEDALRQIQADILFLGVDGFDVKIGVMTPSLLESRVNRVMASASRRVAAVCDSTKFERRSLAVIIPPSQIHTVVTDKNATKEQVDALRTAGIEVILA
jgi:DeoR family transcriptional regulator of aga operon